MNNEDYAKALMNPELFSEMLNIDHADKDFLIQSLYTMSYIRATEHKLALEKKNGKIVRHKPNNGRSDVIISYFPGYPKLNIKPWDWTEFDFNHNGGYNNIGVHLLFTSLV